MQLIRKVQVASAICSVPVLVSLLIFARLRYLARILGGILEVVFSNSSVSTVLISNTSVFDTLFTL